MVFEIITIPKSERNTEHDINIYLQKNVSFNPELIIVCYYLDDIVYRKNDINLHLEFDLLKKHIDNHFENNKNKLNKRFKSK